MNIEEYCGMQDIASNMEELHSVEDEAVESLEDRQRREKRELRAETMEMLKKARDKNSKKQVREKIAAMESALAAKHSQENREIEEQDSNSTGVGNEDRGSQKISRSEKKKEQKRAQAQALRAEAQREAASMIDYKSEECKRITRRLEPLGFEVSEVEADGHCLFRSVGLQLSKFGWNDQKRSVESLRKLAAEYISQNCERFVPFLMSDDGELEDVSSYCDRLTRSSPVLWGGEPELVALSESLGKSIVVFSADADPVRYIPLAAANGNGNGEEIRVSFHKHYYGLGNHYNEVILK